jgi:hypothetical protein
MLIIAFFLSKKCLLLIFSFFVYRRNDKPLKTHTYKVEGPEIELQSWRPTLIILTFLLVELVLLLNQKVLYLKQDFENWTGRSNRKPGLHPVRVASKIGKAMNRPLNR